MNNQTNEAVAWLLIGVNDHEGMSMVRETKPKIINSDWWKIKPLAVIEPNTITITESEYAKLKADAERLAYISMNTELRKHKGTVGKEKENLKALREAIDQAIKESK